MPRPTRQAAAAAATAPKPMEGFTIALKGTFRPYGHTQTSLDKIIRELGGRTTINVGKTTTHLVCTELYWKNEQRQIKNASADNILVVNPYWVIDSEGKDSAPDHEETKYATFSLPVMANGAVSGADGSVDSSQGEKKKKKDDDENDDEGEAESPTRGKKRKMNDDGASQTAKTNGTKTKSKAKKTEVEEDLEDKVVAEGQFVKKKNAVIPIDEGCPHTHCQVFIDPKDGMIWDASLNQSNSSNNNNKFYRVQVLFDPKKKEYSTWTRWGRVGERGQSALLGNGTLPDAIKQFQKKFKDKSGLQWENRTDDPKYGKYVFVERSYDDSDSESDDDEDSKKGTSVKKEEAEDDEPPVASTLDQSTQDLMSLIFNQQYFQATMAALNYDANKLPLGKLSKTTIARGFQQLKDLAAVLNDQSLAMTQWSLSYHSALEQFSNAYYSIIPHAFGRNRPPLISHPDQLKKEIELLESLSDMKAAEDIMKIKPKTKDIIHPLDRQFQGLNMQEMTTLDHQSNEFDLLARYLNESRGSTHNVNYKISDIWRIERSGEKHRFDSSPFASIPSDRRLLWHGSRCTNFGGILSQGLRIAPPEAPVSGYMFGKGIYLADMSSKSAGYCASYVSGGHALLLLCEAELGAPMQELVNADYEAGNGAKKKGMVSTWGQGRMGPEKWMDSEVVHPSLSGVMMPDTNIPPGNTKVKDASLWYNEYICYDVAQVRLRYLFRVKM